MTIARRRSRLSERPPCYCYSRYSCYSWRGLRHGIGRRPASAKCFQTVASFQGQGAAQAGLIIKSLDQHQRCDASETVAYVPSLTNPLPFGVAGFFGRESRESRRYMIDDGTQCIHWHGKCFAISARNLRSLAFLL
jgi:hypothetical protein